MSTRKRELAFRWLTVIVVHLAINFLIYDWNKLPSDYNAPFYVDTNRAWFIDRSHNSADDQYVDKAHETSKIFRNEFHFVLKSNADGNATIRRGLEEIIDKHENYQVKLAGHDVKNYRVDLALQRFLTFYLREASSNASYNAAKRYVVAVGDERALEISRFLASNLDCSANASLSNYTRIADKYDAQITDFIKKYSFSTSMNLFWHDFKLKNTPAIAESCLKEHSTPGESWTFTLPL